MTMLSTFYAYLPHSSLLSFTDVLVDFDIEKNQQTEWNDAQNQEPRPIVVGRVNRMCSQFRHSNYGCVFDFLRELPFYSFCLCLILRPQFFVLNLSTYVRKKRFSIKENPMFWAVHYLVLTLASKNLTALKTTAMKRAGPTYFSNRFRMALASLTA